MANPLSNFAGATPEAPEMQDAPPQGGGNALAGPSGGANRGQGMPPAPTHAETVTALRHFGALEDELSELMTDPDVGKTDMRSKLIDAMTRLVGEGVVPASGAVRDMGTFPEKPYDQRGWLNQHFMNVVNAQTAILAHHQAGAATGQNLQPGVAPSPDDHQSIMAGMASRYAGGK